MLVPAVEARSEHRGEERIRAACKPDMMPGSAQHYLRPSYFLHGKALGRFGKLGWFRDLVDDSSDDDFDPGLLIAGNRPGVSLARLHEAARRKAKNVDEALGGLLSSWEALER